MYKITKLGRGQYSVSNGEQSFHTTESRMIDALDDYEDEKHEDAQEWAWKNCQKVEESDEEFYSCKN